MGHYHMSANIVKVLRLRRMPMRRDQKKRPLQMENEQYDEFLLAEKARKQQKLSGQKENDRNLYGGQREKTSHFYRTDGQKPKKILTDRTFSPRTKTSTLLLMVVQRPHNKTSTFPC